MRKRWLWSSDQGEVSEFGGAVEAEWKSDRPDAAVHVELHVVEPEHAFDILLAHGRENERTKDGKADLAAVGVA
jgi:hypothetical protein